jgi:hypothetical protein
MYIITDTTTANNNNDKWQSPAPFIITTTKKIPSNTSSLFALSNSTTWHNVISSQVQAKGKSRLKNGTLVIDSTEWRGLISKESLPDTVNWVIQHSNETHSTFGSLTAILFQSENDLITNLGLTINWLTHKAGIPSYRVKSFDAYTLWIRSMSSSSTYNPVDWHAHPEAGIYLHLFGPKSFHYIYIDEWKKYITMEWDSHFPLCFASEKEINKLASEGKIKIHTIILQPGQVIYQPPWILHRLSYDGVGEFASLRFGFLPYFVIWNELWLFLRCIPLFLDVGWKIFWQSIWG